jgi:hypothetical protein
MFSHTSRFVGAAENGFGNAYGPDRAFTTG